MPEGDTIHYAANRIRPVLVGRVPAELRTLHPRFAADRWPERLARRAVEAVEARGKHLLIRFEGGLAIHSHLRMTGHWSVLAHGRRWPRSARRAWLAIDAGGAEVVQFDGPVLELLTDARMRSDPRLAHLGPDILAPELDAERFLRRLREDDPTRPIADALIDQRTIAGIGNLWKSEGCFAARVAPWRPAGRVSDAEALAIVQAIRPRMQRSAEGGFRERALHVYECAGRPCPRCGAASRIVQRHQGDGNRKTFWCPRCQT